MSSDSLPSMAVNLVRVAESISTELAELALAGMGTIAGITLGVMIMVLNTNVLIAASRLKGAIALQPTKQPQKTTVGPLRNERHEVFAHLVANGVSAPQSYARSYACAVDAAARVSAHRLLKNANIRSRIEDHQAEILRKVADTHSAVLEQIKAEVLAQAKAGHLRAACRATERLVKMAEKLERALSQSAQGF